MASAKEMRATVTKNREALRAAIEAAAAKWENGAPSPRQTAEQAIGLDLSNGQKAAAILGGNPPPTIEISFPTAQAAAEALAKVGAEVDKRFSWAEDRDLSKSSGGTTLEAVINGAITGLKEHADQIKAAAG